MKPPTESLFSSDLWTRALEEYGKDTHLTVKLFDGNERVVFGPIHPTPLFRLFDERGYDPGIFAECARRCLAQADTRAPVLVSEFFGLTVVGTSLALEGKIVGAAVAGYAFVDFSQMSEIQRLAKDAGIPFERLWQVAREQKPVPQQRLVLNGELLQVLGDALLRENHRTRQYEETAIKLEEALRAKDRAHQELQQTASALRKSEEHYRTLFDLGPVAVYSCDASGMIQEFNHRAAELWGRTPVLGDSDERFCGSFKLLRPDSSFMPHEQCPMAEVLSGKISEARDAEVLIERPDNSRVTVIVNIRPVKNERGEVLGAINCFYDISGRKQAETAAAALAAIVESSDDAIVSKDLNGIVTSWNKGAERLFGYTAEEAIGQSVDILVPPERLDEEPDIMEHIRNGEAIEHYETIRRRKDGKDLDISLTVSPIRDSQGRVIGASKIARDISDRKRAEEALQRAHDQLESLVQRRTASLRRLSSHLLHVQDEQRRRIARDLHDSTGQYLAALKMNLAQLDQPGLTNAEMVLAESNQLLDTCLAEIRTISYLLHPPMLDESGLASAATWYVEGFTKRSGIQTVLEISPRLERLPTDVEIVLFRALQESLTNVHRHSQSPRVNVRIELENVQVTLSVRDYGRGITPQQLEIISGGSDFGVGLTGMRERVNELGGIFEVLLEKPGTSVKVTLPVAQAESHTANATENSAERKSAA